jgi:hypothetical protein
MRSQYLREQVNVGVRLLRHKDCALLEAQRGLPLAMAALPDGFEV